MNRQVVIFLVTYSLVLGKTGIEGNKRFFTVNVPKTNSGEQRDNILILTKWHIPEKNNATISNFIGDFDIIVCQLENELMDFIIVTLNIENIEDQEKLTNFFKSTEINCFIQPHSDRFKTIKITIEDQTKEGIEKKEIAPTLLISEQYEQDSYILLNIYPQIKLLNMPVKPNEENKTVQHVGDEDNTHIKGWERSIKSRLRIEQKEEENNDKILTFKGVEIVIDDYELQGSTYKKEDGKTSLGEELYNIVRGILNKKNTKTKNEDIHIVLDCIEKIYMGLKDQNSEYLLIDEFYKNNKNIVSFILHDKTSIFTIVDSAGRADNDNILTREDIEWLLQPQTHTDMAHTKLDKNSGNGKDESHLPIISQPEKEDEDDQFPSEPLIPIPINNPDDKKAQPKNKEKDNKNDVKHKESRNDNRIAKEYSKNSIIWLIVFGMLILMTLVAMGYVIYRRAYRKKKYIKRANRKEILN